MEIDFACPVCKEVTKAEADYNYIGEDVGLQCKKCETQFYVEIIKYNDAK